MREISASMATAQPACSDSAGAQENGSADSMSATAGSPAYCSASRLTMRPT